jgi:hypothetical protein
MMDASADAGGMDLAADAQLYSFHVYFVGSKVSSQKRGRSKGINKTISTFLEPSTNVSAFRAKIWRFLRSDQSYKKIR